MGLVRDALLLFIHTIPGTNSWPPEPLPKPVPALSPLQAKVM